MGKSCRLLLALVLLLLAAPALAAPCGGDFNAFLAAIARDAQGQGVSRAVIGHTTLTTKLPRATTFPTA